MRNVKKQKHNFSDFSKFEETKINIICCINMFIIKEFTSWVVDFLYSHVHLEVFTLWHTNFGKVIFMALIQICSVQLLC